MSLAYRALTTFSEFGVLVNFQELSPALWEVFTLAYSA